MQLLQESAGEINGDASLSAVGNSVASLLGASNGEIKTLINQGTVSKLLLEEMGMNIGNVILTRLAGQASQAELHGDRFWRDQWPDATRSFLIDTDDAILVVSGNINLAQEQLDLTIHTDSKGLRCFRSERRSMCAQLQAAAHQCRQGVLAMRAGGAIGLAVLAPVAALIPLINAGPGESSECAKLLADLRVKPVAPPPGKTYHGNRSPRSSHFILISIVKPNSCRSLLQDAFMTQQTKVQHQKPGGFIRPFRICEQAKREGGRTRSSWQA